jgi:hypothetical protein
MVGFLFPTSQGIAKFLNSYAIYSLKNVKSQGLKLLQLLYKDDWISVPGITGLTFLTL